MPIGKYNVKGKIGGAKLGESASVNAIRSSRDRMSRQVSCQEHYKVSSGIGHVHVSSNRSVVHVITFVEGARSGRGLVGGGRRGRCFCLYPPLAFPFPLPLPLT